MKKRHKILGIVGGVLLVAIASVAMLQKDNLKAVVTAKTTSTEELVSQIEDNKKDVEDAIKAYNLEPIRDLTFEEEEQIRKGEITPQAAIEKVMAEGANIKEEPQRQVGVATVDEDIQQLVQDASSKMYTLKAEYLGVLGGIEARAKAEYLALPSKERGLAGKRKIVSKHMGRVAGLEGTCDAKVSDVLAALEHDLAARGFDTAIVGTMKRAYQNEKTLKKAYYMSLVVN